MPTTAPYGSWTSPISAADLARNDHPVGGGTWVGDRVWWLELRPDQDGRYSVRRTGEDGAPVDVLPSPWNARTRVHEYGGGAWAVTPGGVLVFAEFTDQRLYRLDPGATAPVPLTPEPPAPAAWRYGELQLARGGDEVWCVRERHDGDSVARDLVAVPLDGAAAADAGAVRSVLGGSYFLAGARVSPDGRRVAWLAWDHPQMPWDGTELRVAELDDDGLAGAARTVMGSTTESVLQPEWRDADTLYALTDRSGFWNLHTVAVGDGATRAVTALPADLGGPMWTLGGRWYTELPDGRLLTVRTLGTDTLGVLDPSTGQMADLHLPTLDSVHLGPVRDGRVLLGGGGSQVASGLRLLELATGALTDVRLGVDELPPEPLRPVGRPQTFSGPGGREVHAVVYPPRNPDFVAPDGELPPFLALVHGGPTSLAHPALSTEVAYLTSRGIGVVDVNYGGSTGYGREYRERLRGQWGVVDVEDTVAVVRGLAEQGQADGDRLAIRGGSAGGWTVLSALTTSDAFACGVSYYGVTELVQFARETHDFESRYLDGLIGPLPEAQELYERRAPVNNVDGLHCPVLVLQGLDDPVVPPSQAERIVEALRRNGLPHAYRTYAGESHGFRRAATIVDATEAELSFYGQVLGFEPPGIPVLPLERP